MSKRSLMQRVEDAGGPDLYDAVMGAQYLLFTVGLGLGVLLGVVLTIVIARLM